MSSTKVFVVASNVQAKYEDGPNGGKRVNGSRRWATNTRKMMLVWVGTVLTPFLLQLRSYVQMVTPHKMMPDLVVPAGAAARTEQVLEFCPVTGIYIANVWWNILPTHFHEVEANETLCHFVVPQYNMHGAYRRGDDVVSTTCKSKNSFFHYYFYHGSVGYYAFYEEGDGAVCADDWTAIIKVKQLGSFDMNGQPLANDGGSEEYRHSVWFGIVGLAWILYRALIVRRSYGQVMRHLDRCEKHNFNIDLRDTVIYIQESARLTAHDANNLQRLGVIYGLLEGLMTDLFLYITKAGVFALVQCISLSYNLAGIISILFEMVETSTCAASCCKSKWPSIVRTLKRLFFNDESTFFGEVLDMALFQTYVEALNHTKLQKTQHVALAVSYYVWGLIGHGVVVAGMVLVLFSVRSFGAIATTWWRFRTLAPLTSPCCVESALGAHQKLIRLSGYVWNENKLYYSKTSLTSYGLYAASNEETTSDTTSSKQLLLVHEKINWFATPRNNLICVGIIKGKHVECCIGVPRSYSHIQFCDRILGGQQTSSSEWIDEDDPIVVEVSEDCEAPEVSLLSAQC